MTGLYDLLMVLTPLQNVQRNERVIPVTFRSRSNTQGSNEKSTPDKRTTSRPDLTYWVNLYFFKLSIPPRHHFTRRLQCSSLLSHKSLEQVSRGDCFVSLACLFFREFLLCFVCLLVCFCFSGFLGNSGKGQRRGPFSLLCVHSSGLSLFYL